MNEPRQIVSGGGHHGGTNPTYLLSVAVSVPQNSANLYLNCHLAFPLLTHLTESKGHQCGRLHHQPVQGIEPEQGNSSG